MATIILSSSTIAENAMGPFQVGTLSLEGGPDGPFVFALADHPLFEIVATDDNGAVTYDLWVKSGVTFDYEADPRQLELIIAVTDDEENPVETDPVVVDVTDVNEAPTDMVVTAEPIFDNADLGTVVATLEGEDPDEGDILTYAFVNEAGTTVIDHDLFEIVGNEILVKGELTATTHSLWVRVTDSGNPALSTVKPITLTVTKANEPPAVTWDFLDVAEGAGGGTLVGTLSAIDPEGNTVSYTLSEASDTIFDLVDNRDGTWSVFVDPRVKLSLKEASHQGFTVEIFDGVETFEESFDINLVENQAPDVAFEPEELARTVPAGTVVGILSAMDNENDAVEYTLLGAGAGLFEIAFVEGSVVVRSLVEISFGNPAHRSFTVQVSDNVNTFSESFNLTFANAAPETVYEAMEVVAGVGGGTIVATLTASDEEGDEVTYELSPASAEVFTIVDLKNGTWNVIVRAGVTLEYGNPAHMSFTVIVSDGSNSSDEPFDLNLSENLDPEVVLTPVGVEENEKGAKVAELSATDPEGAALTYKLVGASAGLFTLVDVEGGYDIVLKPGIALNFENGEQTLQVEVSDGVNTVTETMTLDIVDVNEAPAVAFAARKVNEGTKSGTVVGRLSATDPEGDEISYELSSTSAKYFTLEENAAGGYDVLVLSGVTLDYENAYHRSFRVTATDGENEVSRTLALSLADRIDVVTGSQSKNTLKGAAGSDVIKGLGGDDTLIAYAGNDTLYGGTGRDALSGGSGQDVFVFDAKPDKANVDRVTDFNVTDDSIWLENKVFAKLGNAGSASKPAQLSKSFFATDKAKDKNDYLIYSKKTGVLSYDADGSGSGKAVEIATLSKKLALTYKDFFII